MGTSQPPEEQSPSDNGSVPDAGELPGSPGVPPDATQILESLSDAVFSLDEEWRFRYINARAEALLRRPRAALLGRNIWSEYPDAVGSDFYREYHRAAETRERVTFDAYSPGLEAWLLVSVSPLSSGLSVLLQDITQRKATEAALQERAAIVDASFDAVIGKSLDGIITSWNPSATKLYGYTDAEAVGKHISLIIPPQCATDLPPIMEKLRRGERIEAFETTRRHKDGSELLVSLTISPIRDAHGEIIGASKVARDISQNRRAELAVQHMMEGAHCLLWQATVEDTGAERLQCDLQFSSEQAAQRFLPLDLSEGQEYIDAWRLSRPREDAERADRYSRQEVRAGRNYQQAFRCHSKEGTLRWLWENVRVEVIGENRWRCIGVCTDITEQKQAEEERDRFFTLSLDLLCVVHFNGCFTRMNPAFETVLGYTRAELMAKPFLDLVHPDDRDATMAEMAQLTAGKRALHFENRCLCRDGSYRWLAWTSVAFQDFLYSAAHDITALKAAEAGLRRANEDLEARVAERTAQITDANAQLLATKNEAERANLAKSEFLSRMSHELRTPLNAILGFGQILDKEELTRLQKESVGYIIKGGRHLLDLINEVLDIARVESGHIELSLEAVALLGSIRDACDLVLPLALERRILLDIDDASFGHDYIQADRQRLKQVLINLLSNAIKYNRDGGQVRIFNVRENEDRCRIAVQDTGPGIASDEQKKLFVPFERLNAALTGIEGTGLGLTLSQRLVTAMGGTLTLESVPGEGTTFFIELPLVPSPLEALAEHPIDLLKPGQEDHAQRSATLLYIEDNLSNMRLLEVLLRSRPGITLLPAMQGSVGLDLARQHAPDLILLDLNLPDLSGKEVLARLQASPITRDIPVIVLSADATSSQISQLREAGAHAYFTKPLDITEFLDTLDTMLAPSATGSLPTEPSV